ncbi:transporter [Natronococcus sp. JC468]|nr:transporter [Natronococcus sp. JC468]NKE34459.1 transporter [Natronococcus sp. JC468]
MVRVSTVVILVGVALLVLPVPPVITAALAVPVILAGIALRVLTEL